MSDIIPEEKKLDQRIEVPETKELQPGLLELFDFAGATCAQNNLLPTLAAEMGGKNLSGQDIIDIWSKAVSDFECKKHPSNATKDLHNQDMTTRDLYNQSMMIGCCDITREYFLWFYRYVDKRDLGVWAWAEHKASKDYLNPEHVNLLVAEVIAETAKKYSTKDGAETEDSAEIEDDVETDDGFEAEYYSARGTT